MAQVAYEFAKRVIAFIGDTLPVRMSRTGAPTSDRDATSSSTAFSGPGIPSPSLPGHRSVSAVFLHKDTARYRLTDDARVVEASFSCSVCLCRSTLVVVRSDGGAGRALCYCAACRSHTEVSLNADQVLRLTLAPPFGAPIHLLTGEQR